MDYPFEPYPDVASLQQAIADAFCQLAEESIASHGVFRVSLSGGSTPRRVYEMLSQRDLDWKRIHLFWGDERNVPHDHPDSNFRMVREALIDHVAIPVENVHPVPVAVDAPAAAAAEYERTLREQFQLGQTEFPHWDLVLLGMGDDAHTASLFPETDALQIQDRLFVENFVPKFDAYRYTMTYPTIAAGKNIWFMIAGASKHDALRHVLAGTDNPRVYPSQRITPTRWFVDSDASGGNA